MKHPCPDGAHLGSLCGVLQQIRPALDPLDHNGVPPSNDKALVQRVAVQNGRDVAAQQNGRSETLAGLFREGKLKIVCAMHDVASSKVGWCA